MRWTQEREILHGSALSLALDEANPQRIRASYVNGSSSTVWIAQEPHPAYRFQEEALTLSVWYGYVDEVYGPYRGQYMLPPMVEVAPNREHRWELEDPDLVTKVLQPKVVTWLHVRASIIPFTASRTRGHGQLDEYLEKSCLVRSKVAFMSRG